MKTLSLFCIVTLALCATCLQACPLCQSGDGYTQETVSAYKGITLLLALLPIVGAGGIFSWIYRRQKAAHEEQTLSSAAHISQH